ncbi:hypothetical protein H4R18_005784 [Coemansia javaensis]|uniref:Uncharacterized protein n=1 Tax=Coemansia javaensis TaxID=2761396 RepID=A0A9W8LCS7_9FUNG|nr:hypothetical protein H4R18_005784 [Coemansia javaensis]
MEGSLLRAILGLPKGTSYGAILLPRKLPTMEHRWRTKVANFVHHREQPTNEKHILGGLFDAKRAQATRDHAAKCTNTVALLRNTRAFKRRLKGTARAVMTNPIDRALAGLQRGDHASAACIALAIDRINTRCLGRRSLVKQHTSLAVE